ncbi:uncharacterized protein LOC117104409 [Anneissia japonica]|uniref:uncharacterized protein LOC117104409 n=1 Tax=Anneissia japonica TaxID=1529436 RepID=UPI0014259E51|nr:uncharacterized protein LOC117104409 [Anneissia japonica]
MLVRVSIGRICMLSNTQTVYEVVDSCPSLKLLVVLFVYKIKPIDGETVRVLSVITLGGKLVARILGSTSKYAVKAIGNVGIHLVNDVSKATKRTLGIVSRAAGITVSAAAIAVNIHTIVSSALDLSNNCPDKAADKIEEIAKDLANIEAPTLEDLVIESVLAAADEIQIPHEGDINCSEDDHLFEDCVDDT